MPENNPAAPMELAAGFNPFSDDNAPQVQNKVEEAPILNNEQQAPPQQEELSSAPQTSFDPNQFVKE